MAFYMFTRSCRQILIAYLRTFFSEPTKHWNGMEYVDLPAIHVIDKNEYDAVTLPVITTDSAVGQLRTLSFNQVIGQWTDYGGVYGPENATYQVYGGRGDFDVTIYCAANSQDTQQKLTDTVAIYLTVGRTWLLYNRYIGLGDVRIVGDGEDQTPSQEKVYHGYLTVPITADWRLIEPKEVIQRINVELDSVTPDDPFEDPLQVMSRYPPGTFVPLDAGKKDVIAANMIKAQELKKQAPLVPSPGKLRTIPKR